VKLRKTSSKSSNFRIKIKKSIMETWDNLDKESKFEKEDEEEVNLALILSKMMYILNSLDLNLLILSKILSVITTTS